MSGVSSTSSSWKRSRSTSPVDDASGTIRFIWPKRVLSWWWSASIESGTCPSTSGSAMRLSFAQSSARRTRSATSSGQRRWSPSSCMNAYSPGRGASPWSTMTVSLPRCSSASMAATKDPSASPSGFSCVVRMNRSWPRIASATAVSSLAVVWGELIDQLRHADPALDRRIVLEGQLWGSLHSEFTRESRLEHRVCSLQSRQRVGALPLGAQHRDEDAGVTQVGRGLDPRDRDEADARVLELPDSFREHLSDGFVYPAHSIRHQGYSSA